MNTQIKRRSPSNKRLEWNKERLTELYWEDGKTLDDIGKIYGVTRERVRQIMSKFGIPRTNNRKHSRRRLTNKYTNMDELLKNHPFTSNNLSVAKAILGLLPIIRCADCGKDINSLPKIQRRRINIHHIVYPATKAQDIQILCMSCHVIRHVNGISFKNRLELYQKFLNGVRNKELVKEYNIPSSSVCRIIKNIRESNR